MRPLAIDLFTGLHGWAEGLIAAGWHVVGFDLEDMSCKFGEHLPEDHFNLVLQDVLTLHGSQFKTAHLIVGSSPCQEFSYRAMPWKRAKALGPPELGMALFNAQFRIQREASEAAGRHIPMVVENVRGANPWVGRAKYHYGSYYLWGDVPAIMPMTTGCPAFKGGDRNIGRANGDGAHQWNTEFKIPGFRFDGSGKSFQTASVSAHQKAAPKAGFNDGSDPDRMARMSSKSSARKAASAKIAKIPFDLAHWIGRVFLPETINV